MTAPALPARSATPARPIRFRAERLGDQAWLASRLPPDRGRGQSFVGVSGGTPTAAFAVAPPRDAHRPPGLGLALHLDPTLPPPLAAATERAIADKAAGVAAALGLGPLHAWPPPEHGSPEAARFARLGFKTFDTLTTYDVRLAPALATLHRLMSPRAAARGAGLRVSTLAAAPPEAVLGCWEACLGPRGAYRPLELRRLRGVGPDPFHARTSRLLLRGRRVVGVLLTTAHAVGTSVEADVEVVGVRPEATGGLAPLLRSALTAARDLAITRLRFFAHADARFTHRLARRCGGTVRSAKLQMRRPADPPPST